MTPTQRKTLEYVRTYIAANDYAPSLEEIADHLGLKSKSGPHRILGALVQQGLLRRTSALARGIELASVTEDLAGRLAAALVTDHGVYEDDDHPDRLIIATPAEARATLLAALRA